MPTRPRNPRLLHAGNSSATRCWRPAASTISSAAAEYGLYTYATALTAMALGDWTRGGTASASGSAAMARRNQGWDRP